jgi:amino acid adenylation domain-containing protein
MTPPVAPSAARPLSARARELLAERAAVAAAPPIPRRTDRSRARLSAAQQRIWLHDQLEGGAGYVRPVALRITGPLDVAALERAIGAIVGRHEALHSRLETGPDGLPLLRIVPEEVPSLVVEELDRPPGEPDGAVTHPRILAEAYRPFDLLSEPPVRARLFRHAPDAHLLLTVFHHVAFDGWSVAIYLRELAAAYAAARGGEGDGLGKLAIQCGDIVEHAAAADSATDEDIAYWRSALSGVEPALALPPDRPRRPYQSRDAGRVALLLPADLVERLRELSRHEEVSLFMTVAAALEILLSRYSGQEDFLIGIPVAGRTRPEMEALIGCFINTLALRADLTGSPTFRELLQRVRRTATGAFAHQALPFEQVVRLLDGRSDRQIGAGVQVLLNFRNLPAAAPGLDGLVVAQADIPPAVTLFDLELDLTDTGSGLTGALVYPAALFDRATIARLAGHLRVLLESVVADPERPTAQLPMIPDEERRELLEVLSGSSEPVRERACIHHLIARRAAAAPGALAVAGPAGELTYAALMARAQAVAAALRSAGVERGDRIGLAVDRSPDLIAAMLGVMMSGAAYVPLDPEYPDERLSFMIGDASLRCIVTDRASQRRLTGVAQVPLLPMDGLHSPEPAGEWTAGPATEADAAYVIYTSGSTGMPKGVVIGHRALAAFAETTIDGFGMTPRDRFLQFSTPNFDASVVEIFPTLAAGGTVVLRDAAMAESAEGFLAGCARWGVTMAVPATAFWHELVATLAAEGKTFPPSLRLMAPGGERMLPERAALWRRVAPGAELHNAYGPTETTVHVTRYLIPAGYDDSSSAVPIGRPIPSARAYILDRAGELAPRGVPGELCIGGSQLAQGYLNRPELTAERFIPDPFAPGERLYRTGDLVRWRTDGNLEYLGRLDRQVKVRGFRVEIGEIESALLDSPATLECAVEARVSDAGDQRLIAYVVPARAGDPAGSLAELSEHLRRRLPGYMIPTLVPVPAIPRTPNGKLDRAALPAPALRTDGAESCVPPRSPLEFQLVQLWERLLDVRPIGVRDDFFALGGHSLLAVRMAYELERTCGHKLPLGLLFETATIEQLAAELIRTSTPADDGQRQLLNATGTRPPLIFFHGDILGAGLYCREVARRLGPDQPVYVVGPSRPGGPATIEAMAAAELEWIRAAAAGRYRLAGFCNGGLVAYEIARQLEQAGERAELVVMIDASPRNVGLDAIERLLHAAHPAGDADERLAWRAAMLRRIADALQRWRIFRSRRRSDRLRVAGRKGLELIRPRSGTDSMEDAATGASGAGTAELRFVSRAVNAYVPRPYGGRVHLVVSNRVLGGAAEARRWERCAGTLVVHDTPVDHQAVVTVAAPDVLHECLAVLSP